MPTFSSEPQKYHYLAGGWSFLSCATTFAYGKCQQFLLKVGKQCKDLFSPRGGAPDCQKPTRALASRINDGGVRGVASGYQQWVSVAGGRDAPVNNELFPAYLPCHFDPPLHLSFHQIEGGPAHYQWLCRLPQRRLFPKHRRLCSRCVRPVGDFEFVRLSLSRCITIHPPQCPLFNK